MLILFWACAAAVAYVYFGYPLLLWLGALGRPQSIRRDHAFQIPPMVSVIVAAHNEESQIESKLRSILDSEYPRDRIDILIGSDGSSDRTESIVRRFAREGVGLISFPQQQGKSAMQNRLASLASGEILVFTDADCCFATDAIGLAVENFADSRVGLVTARPCFINENETAITENEAIYLRYETWLRRQESARGLLAVASGSFLALRRSLWRPLEPLLGDDFVFPLRVARTGMLNVLDERIRVTTRLPENPGDMFRAKTRIISKDLRGLIASARVLNPIRYGALAVSLWSHKLLRWFVPYFLVALFASNLLLLTRPFLRATFVLQAILYLLAVAGLAAGDRMRRVPWSVPLSFAAVNLAALIGTARVFAGRTSGRWTPARNVASSVRIHPSAQPRELK